MNVLDIINSLRLKSETDKRKIAPDKVHEVSKNMETLKEQVAVLENKTDMVEERIPAKQL